MAPEGSCGNRMKPTSTAMDRMKPPRMVFEGLLIFVAMKPTMGPAMRPMP
mgnify:CR=1 FL=1